MGTPQARISECTGLPAGLRRQRRKASYTCRYVPWCWHRHLRSEPEHTGCSRVQSVGLFCEAMPAAIGSAAVSVVGRRSSDLRRRLLLLQEATKLIAFGAAAAASPAGPLPDHVVGRLTDALRCGRLTSYTLRIDHFCKQAAPGRRWYREKMLDRRAVTFPSLLRFDSSSSLAL